VKITIDGREYEVDPSQTILQVACDNGIYIPALCYHPRTGKAGRCRACLVEVEGIRGLQESCAVEARDGMVVRTDTEAVIAARKMVVELQLADGHHDCIACESNGKCELQDMAYSLGIEHPSIVVDARSKPVDESSEGIIRDNDKCIQCGRCVSACNNTVTNEVLDFGWRGHDTEVICDNDVPMGESTCVQCGECVQICPVGALIYKPSKGKARNWETEKTRITCPYCGVGCQIDLHKKGNKYIYAEATEKNWDKLPNRGMLCVKGRFGLDFCQSPDRLTKPLIRRKKDGELQECEWDEALDFVADNLKKIQEENGRESVGVFASAKVTNEENYQIMRFARGVLGTHSLDHCARL